MTTPQKAPETAAERAFGIETFGLTKRFGAFVALDDVSIKVAPGEVHALLGENGAGKSTLVKCIVGYQGVDAGQIMVAGREAVFANPREAHAAGIGMVYQHFTLVPSMTVAENLVMARPDVPAVIDWAGETRALEAFLDAMPFRVPLDRPVSALAAGERQKTEILKQLYLRRRFLILDEPTSVLTPGEADEMLGLLKAMTQRGELTILLITHKFREVYAFADRVSVLRRGRLAGAGAVNDLDRRDMAELMIGAGALPQAAARDGQPQDGAPVLSIKDLRAEDDTGMKSIRIAGLHVQPREIVGVAGVSGNGQKELVEVLAGQRPALGGEIRVGGAPYRASRPETMRHKVRLIPEEPLRNACAPRMSVTENLAFRSFDRNGGEVPAFWLDMKAQAANAARLIRLYGVKVASREVPIATLSGGNVQRAVLARELSEDVRLLIVANPCFGLDFSAVAEIRSQIVAARNGGAAVLLVSEDLDELLELSDRVVVMSAGEIVYETPIAQADMATIGAHMAGQH